MPALQRYQLSNSERVAKQIRRISDLHPSALGLLVASALGNLTNLIYHLLMARALGPAEYGALGAMVATLAVVTVPVAAIQATLTRSVAAGSTGYRDLAVSLSGRRLRQTVAVTVLAGIALATPFASFLDLDSVTPIVVLTLFIPFNFLATPARAFLLGLENHNGVALSIATGVITKLAVGFTLVTLGFGLLGGVLGIVAGEAITMAVAVIRARRLGVAAKFSPAHESQPGRGENFASIMAFVAVWGLVSVDVVFARHRLSPVAAGEYAAAATLARGALFLPAALAMTALARFSAPNRVDALRTFRKVTVLTIGAGFGVVVALAVTPEAAIQMVLGSGYNIDRGLLVGLGVAAALVGIVNITVHFILARMIPGAAAIMWFCILFAAVGLNLVAPSGHRLASVMIGASGTAIGLTLLLIRAEVASSATHRHTHSGPHETVRIPDEVSP